MGLPRGVGSIDEDFHVVPFPVSAFLVEIIVVFGLWFGEWAGKCCSCMDFSEEFSGDWMGKISVGQPASL